jgi:dihydroflavonol-4-reductase
MQKASVEHVMASDTPVDLHEFGQRVFVTGGSGFIGAHVVKALCRMGKTVSCLVLPTDDAPLLEGLDIQRIDGDLCTTERLDEAMDGCELVFHLAAIYALWLPDYRRIFEVNVDGTRRLLKAAKEAGVKRVVHTSSIAAVGHRPGPLAADESTKFNDWDLADAYVLSKYISELEALQTSRWHPLEVVAVNPSFPFGAGDIAPTPTGRLIQTIIKGRLPFYSDGGFNAVDVRDVAHGHILAAACGKPGERYLLSGHNVTYEAFGHLVAGIIHKRAPRMRMPSSMLRTAGRCMEFVSDHVTGRPPLLTERSAAYAAGRYLWFSHEHAAARLGYEPRPLEEALRESIRWFQDHPEL